MTDYREVAKKLGVKHLYGRWGISLKQGLPGGATLPRLRFVQLDGWIFDPHAITEAIANDPDMGITYEPVNEYQDRCAQCGKVFLRALGHAC